MHDNPTPASSDLAARPYRPGLQAIFDVVARLRGPGGCPWDREQTHQSLRPYLLEETYELLEAIDLEDDAKIREELGDVLLQVAMHAEIAAQAGRFDAASVSESVAAKMVSRHPHVYGDTEVAGAAEVLKNWERNKLAEAVASGEVPKSVMDRVPKAMPALAWTLGIQKRAARVGLDHQSLDESADLVTGALETLEGGTSLDPLADLGDLLFAVVNMSRKLKLNPEDALRAAGQRFASRFGALESALEAEGKKASETEPAELDRLWDLSKGDS
jgi:MazG family protein